jgi:hypothetical protein
MKVKYAAWFALVFVALSIGWYLWGSRRSPRGQPPLTQLTSTNFDQFKGVFNGAADRGRLVLLLSPT